MMERINFVGVGAPKCGTTWLSAQLEAHPEIGFAPAKEIYFFADTIARRLAGEELRCYERGIDWYHEQFPPLTETVRARGEFCPSYLYSEVAAERMATYSPDIKLLFCLRPPVDMMYSWYWYNRNGVVAQLPLTFEEAMEVPLIRDLGSYALHLKPYLERFPRKNMMFVEFNAIRNEPQRVREEVYKFLGVTPNFTPASDGSGRNAARTSRFAWAQSAAHKIHGGLTRTPGAAQLLQSPWVAQSLEQVYHRLNSREQKYPELAPEARQHWENYYAEDQETLAELLRNSCVVK